MGSDFFIRKTFEYTLKDLLFARRENFGRTLILILINRSGHESHNFFVHPSFPAYNHANRPCQSCATIFIQRQTALRPMYWKPLILLSHARSRFYVLVLLCMALECWL